VPCADLLKLRRPWFENFSKEAVVLQSATVLGGSEIRRELR
jgi:hypothetical protein